jgi:hypothetical protein
MSIRLQDLQQWHDGILRTTEAMIAAAIANIRYTRVVNVPIVVGVSGTPVAIGDHVFVRLGLNGAATIRQFSIAATVAGAAHSGSCRLDVRAGSSLASVSSICGSNFPNLSSQAELSDQSPTGWVTTIADAAWLYVVVTSTDGVLEVVGLTLRMVIDADVGVAIVGTGAGDVLVDGAGNTMIFGG